MNGKQKKKNSDCFARFTIRGAKGKPHIDNTLQHAQRRLTSKHIGDTAGVRESSRTTITAASLREQRQEYREHAVIIADSETIRVRAIIGETASVAEFYDSHRLQHRFTANGN